MPPFHKTIGRRAFLRLLLAFLLRALFSRGLGQNEHLYH